MSAKFSVALVWLEAASSIISIAVPAIRGIVDVVKPLLPEKSD